MINEIVNVILEVIFGLFIISLAANLFLGIDVVAGLASLWNRILYGKKDSGKKIKD